MADQSANEARLAADVTKLQTSRDGIATRVAAYAKWIDDLLAALEATAGKGLSEEATNALFTNLEALNADMDTIATSKTPPPAPPRAPAFPAGV